MNETDTAAREAPAQWFVIQAPVRTVAVPVLRDPIDARSVIARLKTDTVVKALSSSAVWLCIELPKGERGYVSIAQTRPLTPEEQAAMSQPQRASNTRNGSRMRTLAEGMTSTQGSSRRLRSSAAGVFATLAIAACALGVFIGQIAEQECITYAFGGTSCQTVGHPYASIGGVFVVVGCVLLLAAIVSGVTWLTRSHH